VNYGSFLHSRSSFRVEAKKALSDKGFIVEEAKDENDFLERIHAFDEAWIISSKEATKDSKRVNLTFLTLAVCL
jgi:hypothetical protein